MPAPSLTEAQNAEQFLELCAHMGLALAHWQRLENAHFLLFAKMVGVPKQEICSVLYHGIPSFEGRRVMVERVALYALTNAEQQATWKRITKAIKTVAPNRNKIAHYTIQYEQISGPTAAAPMFTAPFLQPLLWNEIDRLKGHVAERPGHKISIRELNKYMGQFTAVTEQILEFTRQFPLPPSRQGLALLSELSQNPAPQGAGNLSPSKGSASAFPPKR